MVGFEEKSRDVCIYVEVVTPTPFNIQVVSKGSDLTLASESLCDAINDHIDLGDLHDKYGEYTNAVIKMVNQFNQINEPPCDGPDIWTTEPLGIELPFVDLWQRLAVVRIDGRKLNVRLDAKTPKDDIDGRELMIRVTAEIGGLMHDEIAAVLDTMDDMENSPWVAQIQNNGLEIMMV